MVTVNRLCRELGIKHPLDRSTCIGYGKAKPTCGNLAAIASRSSAVSILEDICDAIADGSSTESLKRDLETVAHLLHCKRWHQYQAAAKAQEWQRKLDDSGLQITQEPHSRRSEPQLEPLHRLSNSRQASQLTGPTLTLTQDEYNFLHTIRAHPQAFRFLLSTLDEYQRTSSTSNRSLSHRRSPGSLTRVSANEHSLHTYLSELEGEDNDSGYDEPRSEISHPRASRRSTAFHSANFSSRSSVRSSSVSSTASSASSSSRISSGSQGSENTCAICLSAMTNRRNLWTCTTCHNDTHVDCFDQWMARSAEGNVTCVYCRSPAGN